MSRSSSAIAFSAFSLILFPVLTTFAIWPPWGCGKSSWSRAHSISSEVIFQISTKNKPAPSVQPFEQRSGDFVVEVHQLFAVTVITKIVVVAAKFRRRHQPDLFCVHPGAVQLDPLGELLDFL